MDKVRSQTILDFGFWILRLTSTSLGTSRSVQVLDFRFTQAIKSGACQLILDFPAERYANDYAQSNDFGF
ncbi:MAG: hypothetical protein HWQ36_01160 [Nostoc sp. NMS2]|uniref:hypothetical protein n=1 Tax=Nostoc sp. NMS2 TaxID=2815389 RepID=UPI0025E77A95|nr:hypothetical protein [Nostoc sp. NMS2]MBN3989185.1 hypothetical protein [Nostoc sp. NMS2]